MAVLHFRHCTIQHLRLNFRHSKLVPKNRCVLSQLSHIYWSFASCYMQYNIPGNTIGLPQLRWDPAMEKETIAVITLTTLWIESNEFYNYLKSKKRKRQLTHHHQNSTTWPVVRSLERSTTQQGHDPQMTNIAVWMSILLTVRIPHARRLGLNSLHPLRATKRCQPHAAATE